jgi:hypothetical protein
MSDYTKYRGKCKTFCEKAIGKDPTLTLVRGYYFCPIWNKEDQHWWTVKKDGSIYDPTKDQFPSKGHGIYREFDGTAPCEQCGKILNENEFQYMGNYITCSTKCSMALVGL